MTVVPSRPNPVTPLSAPNERRYVVLQLQRRNPHASWGIGVAAVDNTYCISKLFPNSCNIRVLGAWECLSSAALPILRSQVHHFTQTLHSTRAQYNVPIEQVLKPFDRIRVISGVPASDFPTIEGFAQVIRAQTTLHLIVERTALPKLSPIQLFSTKPLPSNIVRKVVPKREPIRNPLFQDQQGQHLVYCDDDEPDLDDQYKLPPITDFNQWLTSRKRTWQGQYSWNRRKRQKIEESLSVPCRVDPTQDFTKWLELRKSQWRLQWRRHVRDAPIYDAIVQEAKARPEPRRHLDLDWLRLLDGKKGCPDDVVAHVLNFLPRTEHSKFLRINQSISRAFSSRQGVFPLLCDERWTLPRRPRKPWVQIYFRLLKDDVEASRKQWDDLLMRASQILDQSDQVNAIERMVERAEETGQFDVNYVSSVVCERNSLLNLAVIHGRVSTYSAVVWIRSTHAHDLETARWLVEAKNADVESCDRGSFTALLNAAYSGCRPLVRFLLQRGADRSKIGMFHYSQPLNQPDFKGLTAEGWAKKRGFPEIAELIRLGL